MSWADRLGLPPLIPEQANRSSGELRLAARLQLFEAAAPRLNLEPEAVHLAAELAALPDLPPDDRAALVLLALGALAALRQGSTRAPAGSPEALRRLFAPFCQAEAGLAASMAQRAHERLGDGGWAAIVGTSPSAPRPLLLIEGRLYLHRMWHAEGRLAERLARRLGAGGAIDPPPCPEPPAGTLSEEQLRAVRRALSGASLTLISGGPGTGKTSIVAAILRGVVSQGLRPDQIALAAPTGKAANRIGAALGGLLEGQPEPRTLHRLLGYQPLRGRFARGPHDPLPEQVVIVDECSMIDLLLLERLLSALQPSARLVLLGDAEQLPSVGAGAVFRDLVAAAPLAAVSTHLTRSFRASAADPDGRAILELARQIRAGEVPTRAASAPAELRFRGVERVRPSRPGAPALLDRWHAERVLGPLQAGCARGWTLNEATELSQLFEAAGAHRLLCPTHQGPAGVARCNQHLAALHPEGALDAASDAPLRAGEPILMLRNDYERRLFNGDWGLVLRVQRADDVHLEAVFQRGARFAGWPLETLQGALQRCYAMTIHKAQGSEFDVVGVLLPPEPLPMLGSALLYTAVSRARRGVCLVASDRALQAAVSRRLRRQSGLGERLDAALSEGCSEGQSEG